MYKRILAIVPGAYESAYCTFDFEAFQVYSSGVLENDDLLIGLGCAPHTCREWDCGLVIQTDAKPFVFGHGMGLETAVWIGRFTQAWRAPNDVKRIRQSDVGRFMTGSTVVDVGDYPQRIREIFRGAPGDVLKDVKGNAWEALAVALTAYQRASDVVYHFNRPSWNIPGQTEKSSD